VLRVDRDGAFWAPFLFSAQELITADLRIISPSLDWTPANAMRQPGGQNLV